jgi:hypothetical protein
MTTTRWVTAQKSSVLTYVATEAWNNASCYTLPKSLLDVIIHQAEIDLFCDDDNNNNVSMYGNVSKTCTKRPKLDLDKYNFTPLKRSCVKLWITEVGLNYTAATTIENPAINVQVGADLKIADHGIKQNHRTLSRMCLKPGNFPWGRFCRMKDRAKVQELRVAHWNMYGIASVEQNVIVWFGFGCGVLLRRCRCLTV